jgi:hypothetical protein
MPLTTSAQSLVVSVFRMLGISAQAENPNAPELMDGYARLNEMIDAWAIDRLTQRLVSRTEWPTVAGQASYTIGPADITPVPDWVGPRPEFVETVTLLLTNSTPHTEIPLGEFTDGTYMSVMQKALPNSQATAWKYDPTAPAGTFTFWPVFDSATYPVVVYAVQVLPLFANLTTQYVLRSGYLRALRYNLAREIAHEFGRELPPGVMQLAIESKLALDASNVPMLDLGVDPGLTPTAGRSAFNIWTGSGGH